MSDEKIDKCYWYSFDGKPVLIQLHEPWVGVTYPNDPVVRHNKDGQQSVITVPFLKGICHVHPDGNDVMFILETTDPNPDSSAMAHIGIKRENVAFITHMEKRLITAS